jgi:DNA-binding XRE family transcriptional regulator
MPADKERLLEMGAADRIQALRLKSGRTEQELASELGLTIQSYRIYDRLPAAISDCNRG